VAGMNLAETFLRPCKYFCAVFVHSRSPIQSDFYVVGFNDGTECPVHVSDPYRSELEEGDEVFVIRYKQSGRITAIGCWDTEELDVKASSIEIHESAIDKDWGRGSQFLHEQIHRHQWDFI